MAEYPYPQEPPIAQSSTMAIVSLVSGIVSWFALPLIGAVVAVVTGHMAKREIRDSMGRLTGDGMATVGLVLGYLQLGLTVLGALCVLVALLAFGITTPLVCFPFLNEFGSLLQEFIGF